MGIDNKLGLGRSLGFKIGTIAITSMFALLSYFGVGCKDIDISEEIKENNSVTETTQETNEETIVVETKEKKSDYELTLDNIKDLNNAEFQTNIETILQSNYFATESQKTDFINRALNLYSIDISEYNQKGKNFAEYLFNDTMSKDFTLEQKLDALEATSKLNNLPGENIDHLLEAITPGNSDGNEEIKIGDKVYVDEDSDIKELQNKTNPFNPLSNSTLNEIYGESEIYAILINAAPENITENFKLFYGDEALAYVSYYLDKLNVPDKNRLIISSSKPDLDLILEDGFILKPNYKGEKEFREAGFTNLSSTLSFFNDGDGETLIDKNDIIIYYLHTEGYLQGEKPILFFNDLIGKQQWANLNRKCNELVGWTISAVDACNARACAYDPSKFDNVTSFFSASSGEIMQIYTPPFATTCLMMSTRGKKNDLHIDGISTLDFDYNPFKTTLEDVFDKVTDEISSIYDYNPFYIGPQSKNLTNDYFK